MDIKEQKELVARFLRQCNASADGKLGEYADSLRGASQALTRETEAKIVRWETYKAFNEHAIDELSTERLDHWFDADDAG